MAKRTKTSYYDFADTIDIDAFEEAIGFDVMEQRGDEDVGKCPDLWGLHAHGDTTGKFAINREKKVWHCFVCEGGNLLSLAMSWLDADEDEATEWLLQFAGDPRTDSEFVDDFFKLLYKHEEKKAERMPYFNAHVLDQFLTLEDSIAHKILTEFRMERAIDKRIMGEFQIGCSKFHKKVAPFKGGEKIDEDYYGPCIVLPHWWGGKLVGWQHRWVDHPDTPKWLGKYTNTSDFPKQTTLYNFDRAIKRAQPVIVVESVPTVLFLESHGYSAVSSFGSSIKSPQIRLLEHFDQVIIAPDNDKAGREFATKISKRIKSAWILPSVAKGPGADIGDFCQCGDPGTALDNYMGFLKEPDHLGLGDN